MEFNEKLQELRKSRGLTQAELASALYVSRATVSKWESGRGYPSIESLKDISRYFSVSIDDLLSSEKLLSLAESENKSNIRNMFNFIFGSVDLFAVMLIILPLYPDTIDGFVYSVNLLNYTEISLLNKTVYWVAFISMFAVGVIKLVLLKLNIEKRQKALHTISLILNIVTIIFLVLSREVYAVIIAFVILMIKCIAIYKTAKINCR
jgi:transcriptional regulator with XRE-family HTH domain